MITLADGPDAGLVAAVESMLEDIYSGALAAGMIHEGYYNYVAGKLSQAVAEGLGGTTFGADDYCNTLKAYLDEDIYAFSGARSLTMRKLYASFLTDENGEVRSFAQFKSKIAGIDTIYNVSHLKTEYNHAIASAQMAEKWESLKDFPMLEYRTVGDGRVRDEHALLDGLVLPPDHKRWRTIWPQNDWNCRCTVVPAATDATATPDKKVKQLEKAAKIPAYFQKNVGIDKVAFGKDHAYYRISEYRTTEGDLLAEKSYGMRSVGKIYDMDDLPEAALIPDRAAATSWFRQLAGDKGYMDITAADNIAIRLDEKFARYVINKEDNRFRVISNIIDVLKNPDEIWTQRHGKELQTFYLKYYQGNPVGLALKDGKPETFFEFSRKDGSRNDEGLINKRRGTLKQNNR